MMHWCSDETFLVLSLIPFIGVFFRKIHIWWHTRFNHQCHHVTHCEETHVEHVEATPPKRETLHYPKYLTEEDIDAEREKLLSYDFGGDEVDENKK